MYDEINKIVLIDAGALGQYCKKCRKLGYIDTYPERLKDLADMFFEFLIEIIYKEYSEKTPYKKFYGSKMSGNHIPELCIACKFKVCVTKKYYKNGNSRDEELKNLNRAANFIKANHHIENQDTD